MEEAKAYLTPEEIAMVEGWVPQPGTTKLAHLEMASAVVTAAMHRRALLESEERGRASTAQANRIAGLVGIAVVLQAIVTLYF